MRETRPFLFGMGVARKTRVTRYICQMAPPAQCPKQNRQMRAKHPIIQLSITQVSLLFTCAKRVMATYPWTDLHWAMGCILVKSVAHLQPSNQPEAIMLISNDLTQIRLTQLKLGGVWVRTTHAQRHKVPHFPKPVIKHNDFTITII